MHSCPRNFVLLLTYDHQKTLMEDTREIGRRMQAMISSQNGQLLNVHVKKGYIVLCRGVGLNSII